MRKILLLAVFLILAGCAGVVVMEPSRQEKDADRQIEKAKKAFGQGEMDMCLEYINGALAVGISNNLPAVRVKALQLSSKVYLAKKNFEKAAALLSEGRKIAENDVPLYLPYITLSEAVLMLERGDIKSALKLAETVKDSPEELEPAFLNLKAKAMFSFADIKLSREYAEKALKRAEEKADFFEKTAALKNLALVDMENKNYKDAILKIREAIEIDRKLGDIKSILWDTQTLGSLYRKDGNNEKAAYYFSQGSEMYNSLGVEAKKLYFIEDIK